MSYATEKDFSCNINLIENGIAAVKAEIKNIKDNSSTLLIAENIEKSQQKSTRKLFTTIELNIKYHNFLRP